MTPTVHPRNILCDRINLQEVETETLVYDERSHRAWCLNRPSACIWRLCDGLNTVHQIAAKASVALGSPVSDDLILLTLAELREQALLLPDSFEPVPDTLTRRKMMSRAGLAAAALLPVIAALTAQPAAALGGSVGTGGGDGD
ncbi:MAG: hypothetical protein WCC14_00345 [Acidobacteriaceae bacterium]